MRLPEPRINLGLQVFDSLRAEQESAWLDRVFVSPNDWSAMTSIRSSLILGESGSGKTALRLALAAYAQQEKVAVIPVTWQPVLPAINLVGSALVHDCAEQILNACAKTLLQYFGQRSHSFGQAPDWAKHTLHWFLYHHLHEDRSFFLQRLEDELPREGFSLVASLITTPPPRVLSVDAPPMHVVAQLIQALQRLGLQGIWVLSDGLEPWLEVEHQRISDMLQTWLAALSFFEEPNFAIKLVVPTALAPSLVSTSGISRRRLDVFRLAWTPSDLTHIVEQRLAIATEQNGFLLHDLCTAPGLIRWLTEYGGDSPRGWLELVRPLTELYLARSPRSPLDQADWESVRRRHLPLLHLDLQNERVFVGYREVAVGPAAFRVLRYLYEQRPHTCSREDLYYRAHLDLSFVPREAGDRNWQYPSEWDGVLETALWRIRKSLEPDPKSPVYIITERGKGVRLDHTI